MAQTSNQTANIKLHTVEKVSTIVGEVTNDYITAICKLYANRSDEENQQIVYETMIVERSGRNLAECFTEAANCAYLNALSKLPVAIPANNLTASTNQEPARAPMAPPPEVQPAPPQYREEIPESEAEENPVTEAEPESDVDDIYAAGDTTVDLFSDPIDSPVQSTIEKLDLGLVSASTLTAIESPEESDDPLQKAKDMVITILGKMHLCAGWKAGRILAEEPQVIVDFAPRYNGPKTDEKDALMAIYPEALRMVSGKAT